MKSAEFKTIKEILRALGLNLTIEQGKAA